MGKPEEQDGKKKADFKPFRQFNPTDPQWTGITYQDLVKPQGLSEDQLAEVSSTVTNLTVLGVGTVAPTTTLDVSSQTSPQFTIHYDATHYATFGVDSAGILTITPTGTSEARLSYLTQGSVIFSGPNGKFEQDNSNFFWDNTNNRLGIGCTDPWKALEVRSSSSQLVLSTDANNAVLFQGNGQALTLTSYSTQPWAEALDLTWTGAPAGYAKSIRSVNTDNSNTSSHAYLISQVGGASGGDAAAFFSVVFGQNWGVGLDNSDSDKFKICSSATLGTGDCITISTTGLVTVTANDFYVQRSSTGAPVYSAVANTDDTNTASHARFFAQVGGASGGDPSTTYEISGILDWIVGVDNSDSDKFKIGTGSTLGSNDFFTINVVGDSLESPVSNIAITRRFRFANTDNTSGSSGAKLLVETGGASGGDPFVHYLVSGVTEWATGIDNSDSDKFKISLSSAPGTNDYLTIDTSGNVGIGTTGPDRKLDVLDTAGPQLRLTYTDSTIYSDIQATSSGILYINPSGGGVSIRNNSLTSFGLGVQHSSGNCVALTGDSANQNISLYFYDNAYATAKGRLLYAGGNIAGSRYFGFINDAGDYLGFYSDTQIFGNEAGSSTWMELTSAGIVQVPFGPVHIANGTGASPSYSFLNATGYGFTLLDVQNVTFSMSGTSRILLGLNGGSAPTLSLGSSTLLAWDSSSTAGSGVYDVVLLREGAGSLGQRNGTNAQTFSVYNTYTAGTPDYERLEVCWTSNIAILRTNANGTGTTRTLRLAYGAGTNPAINIGTSTMTFNNVTTSNASTFLNVNPTSTATSGTVTHLAFDLTAQDGGTNSTTIQRLLTLSPTINYTGGTKTGKVIQLYMKPTMTSLPTGVNGGLVFASTYVNAAYPLIVYNTSDEDTNYEFGAMFWSSNVFIVGTTAGGTGTSRVVALKAGGNNGWQVDTNATWYPETALLATTMTQGFLNIPGAAGVPSGAPANTTGFPLYWDSAGLRLYCYTGGAWKKSAAFT